MATYRISSALRAAIIWLLTLCGLQRKVRVPRTKANNSKAGAATKSASKGVAELKAENEALAKDLAELKREQDKNSSNSHKPPSSDRLSDRRKIRKGKKPTGRKRGGQPGHPGHYRAFVPMNAVDKVIDVYPKRCEVCQRKPEPQQCKRPHRHQLFELLPNGGGRHVTEYRFHSYDCVCGERLPANLAAKPKSCFGPRLSSYLSSLTGRYHVSRRDAVLMTHDFFGIHIALGSVSNIEGRMSKALEPASEEAMQSAEEAKVKHVDETSWIRDFARCSAWVFATAKVSVYRIVSDASRQSLQAVFGKQRGVLVSDRASVFLYWAMGKRQVCWSHLLRAFISFSQRDGPEASLGRELVEYTELVFIYWRQHQRDIIDRSEFVRLVKAVRDAMKPRLEHAAHGNIHGVSGSCAHMLKHWDAMWTFIAVCGVEPTNNHAERELRRLVMWRKRSFGSQSERGDRFVERMMTVTHTLRKQDRNSMDFLQQSYSASIHGQLGPKLLSAKN